ncbi:MAG TPA: 4Fe-4S dicluster domain-containing protein [Polyangia bacterium]|jgi:Fe-S-cluster-containing hydrogenase component 2
MRVLKIDLAKCDAGRHCHHECETICAEKVFKLKDAAHAALHIREQADGSAHTIICDQCGDCIDVCPSNALTRNRLGIVLLNKKVCVGCFICVGFCTKDAFEREPGWIEPLKCNSCGVCVKVCPHGALAIVDEPRRGNEIDAPVAAPAAANAAAKAAVKAGV